MKEIKAWIGKSRTRTYVQVWTDRKGERGGRDECVYVTTPDDNVIRLSPENARELAAALIQAVES